MPLGLWKSKWEIHREDMTRFWGEMERRHEEVQAQMERRELEFEEEKSRRATRDAESNSRWTELQEKSDALRSDYNREVAELRRFNTEVLIRMDKTYANLNATLIHVGEELAELKAAVNAQTEAIMKLVDRFEDWEKRQLG
jgi:chromosome segregation ATPase